MNYIRLAIIVAAFGLHTVVKAQVLNVPEVIQEQDQWCWAGVSACVLHYYGTIVSQCTIAEYTRTHATWHDFGSVDCCVNPDLGCNYWNVIWGTEGSLQDILQHWGVENYGYGSYLSLPQIGQELSAGRPFIMRWGWTGGGGHFLVGHGLQDSVMYYMDPWFGEGYTISNYSWVVSAPDHQWTHTNVITTEFHDHPLAPTNFRAYSDYESPTSMTLTWTDPVVTIAGQPLSQFRIRLLRDSSLIAEVDSGVSRYTDTGLVNHQEYAYTAQAAISSGPGFGATASWCAGGSQIPRPPTNFSVADGEEGARLRWRNPSSQIDGTPLNDIDAIVVYRDGVQIDEIRQTFSDTGQYRTFSDTAARYHWYGVQTRDSESPSHLSSRGDSLLAFGAMWEMYDNDFEGGTDALFYTGQWDTTHALAQGGSASLTDSPHGDSPPNTVSYVLLPPVVLRDESVLRFAHAAIVNPATSFASVDISRDARRTFKTIGRYTWASDSSWSDGVADTTDWREETFDLSPYLYDTVTVRLRLVTAPGATGDGWYLDNVSISPVAHVVTWDCAVRAKWNLLSLPVGPPESDTRTLYPGSVSSAFVYDGSYIARDTLAPGLGFWLNFESSMWVYITGRRITHDSIPLVPGWNLIGPPTVPMGVSTVSTRPPGILSSNFFGFDGQYVPVNTLQPGYGYWIRASEPGALILRPTVANVMEQMSRTTTSKPEPAAGNRIELADRTGRTQTLGFGTVNWGSAPLSMYDLPPVPPEGAFDIRFGSQRTRAILPADGMREADIVFQGASYPVFVQWVLNEIPHGTWVLILDSTEMEMKASGSMTLSAPPGKFVVGHIPSSLLALPRSYALDQNFPNPFNPVTAVRYALPTESQVRLRIFNIIGQTVSTLKEGIVQAGYHMAEWDAGSNPSGVYFCRLEASSLADPTKTFVGVRKMVLAK